MTLQAETVAGDLVRASGQSEPPLDVLRVVEWLPGVNVTTEPLDGDGYIVTVPDGAEIIINQRASLVRQRFTLAHELGHYALQVGLAGDVDLRRQHDLERWCDRFAVGLLMPASWVRVFVGRAKPEALAARVVRGPSAFVVSRPAFWLRAAEVRKAWIFEVIVKNGEAQVASGVRLELPPEVAALAENCASQLTGGTIVSRGAYGLSASCVRLGSAARHDSHALAVVTPT